MECGCFTIDDDGDYVTVLATKWRRAARLHQCNECMGSIAPGQSYLDERYLHDGSVYTHKTCACCLSVRNTLLYGYEYGAIWMQVRDCLRDSVHFAGGVPWSKIAELEPTPRAYVCLIIEEIWGDA